MKSPLTLIALSLTFGAAFAQDKPAPAASAPKRTVVTLPESEAQELIDRAEPNVRQIVIDDNSAHIEELRVRGVTQKIVVTPKVLVSIGRTGNYEIITGDGSRDLSDGANTSRGAAGKRVWNVLSF